MEKKYGVKLYIKEILIDRMEHDISVQDIIVQIETLPQESLLDVYKFVTEIKETKDKRIRACCKPDSLMNTKPIYIENFVWNRDELYNR